MRRYLATIAIAALAIGTAQAQGNGKGGGEQSGQSKQSDRGNSSGNAGSKAGNADRGKQQQAPRPQERKAAPRAQRGADNAMPERAQAPGRPADRGSDRAVMPNRGKGGDDGKGRQMERRDANRSDMVIRRDDTIARVSWNGFDGRYDRGGLLDGCPPGLAKKNNGCMPPGLAKQDSAWRMDPQWWGLRSLRDLTGYRYYDGNLVRFGPSGSISGYYPLLGGALAIGNPWPSAYAPAPVDPYYVNYYGLGDDYRYFDGALYRVDPTTQAITAVAALLTGDTFEVGRPMPPGYDVYNVPYDYRDRYSDRDDAYYRYSDGYVYEVDPTTQLVVGAIELLS